MHEIINPASLARPRGFSYAVRSEGDLTVHFAGHTAMDAEGEIVGPGDLVRQFEQTLMNLQTTAEAAGVSLQEVVKLNLYVTDVEAYKRQGRAIGQVYRRFFGDHYPAMTLIQVSRLWDEAALIEIEAVAVRREGP